MTMGSTPADTDGAVADRIAISDRLAAYAEAIDRRDGALLSSLFEPGARIHYGVFDGTIEDLVAYLSAPSSPMVLTHHHIGNIRMRFESETTACSVAYLNCVHRAWRDGVLYDEQIRGRYLDRWTKRDGAWRFTERTLVFDWSRVDRAHEQEWWSGHAVQTGKAAADDPGTAFLNGKGFDRR